MHGSPTPHPTLNRRQLLGTAGCGLLALALVGCSERKTAGLIASPGFLDRLADLTIPATATPGARQAGVAAFVDRAMASSLFGAAADTVAILEAALDKSSAGGAFMRASHERQAALLAAFDQQAFADPRPQEDGATAWRSVKQAIVYGYYTSEPGASVELTYELVPGRYDPDIALKPGAGYLSNNWMANLG